MKRMRDKPRKDLKPIGPPMRPKSAYGCDPRAALDNPKNKRKR